LNRPKEKVADIVKGLELPRDEEESGRLKCSKPKIHLQTLDRPIAHASAEDVLKMVEDLAQIY
jgi:hypothetical protein